MFCFPDHPELYIAPSAVHGVGLYSKIRYRRDEVIFRLNGACWFEQYDEEYRIGPNWFSIGKECWLVPFQNNPGGFLNHSCEANIRLQDDLTVTALRPIVSGAEIVIDYSTTELDPYWQMPCECRASTCRGILRPFYQVEDPARADVLSATPEMLRRCARQNIPQATKK